VLHESEGGDRQSPDHGQREGSGEEDPDSESDRESGEEKPDPGERKSSPAQSLATHGALELLAP